MAKDVNVMQQEKLMTILKDIVMQNLPIWLEELEQSKPPAGSHERRKMSYEEFLAWADEDTLAEWEDGEIIMSSPASLYHQDLAGFLATIMRLFVEHHNLGVILSAPFQMKLENGREPDVLYIAKFHLDRLKETYLEGPADLAVEIVSPESWGRDRGKKFVEYEAGGVAEYWLVDPERQWIECYQLSEKGRYRIAFSGESGTYHSRELSGFWIQVDWLWQDPLPDVARTAWEIIGVEGLRQVLSELEQREKG
jgi:Uma2 family endonuclease